MSKVPESSYRCIQLDQNTVVILLNYPNEAHLSGIFNIKSICGTIQILGYNLTPDAPAIPVYSVKEYNTLKVTPINDGKIENDTSYLKSLNVHGTKIDEIVKKSMCYSHSFVIFKNEESNNYIPFFRNYNFPLSIQENIDDSVVRLLNLNNRNIFTKCAQWDELVEKFLQTPRKIVICGGKNVGKSTFLRYLVNRHLAKWPKVLVLDFDPGQSEFTVMGCLSAVLVNQPLVGPNFSHILSPARSFFLCDTSVSTCSGLYREYVEKLVNFCNFSNYKNIPWIVNTMGFTKGLGIQLLGHIMNTVDPTDVIQIISDKEKNNFPGPLTLEFFKEHDTYRNSWYSWKSDLHTLPSIAEKVAKEHPSKSSESSLDPATKRNIVTMMYFKKALMNTHTDLLSIIPRKIKISDVCIIITKPTSKEIEMTMTVMEKLCCINANLVALCDSRNMEENCLGFGIVRGFDIETEYIYLITPLSDEIFTKVATIKMSSSIELPQVFYHNQISRINGPCPYINYKTPDKLNQQIRKTSSRVRHSQDSRFTSGDIHESNKWTE